ATRLFARAVELDPSYGFAHGMLANMYAKIWKDDPSDSDEVLKEAYHLAKRAVELDSNDSTCFTILGQIHLLRGSFDLALQYAKRAIEINPNNQWNVADMGFILVYAGLRQLWIVSRAPKTLIRISTRLGTGRAWVSPACS